MDEEQQEAAQNDGKFPRFVLWGWEGLGVGELIGWLFCSLGEYGFQRGGRFRYEVALHHSDGPISVGICDRPTVSVILNKDVCSGGDGSSSLTSCKHSAVLGGHGRRNHTSNSSIPAPVQTSVSGHIESEDFFYLVVTDCRKKGKDTKIEYSYHFVNPGGEELSTANIPYKTISPISTGLWGCVLGVWILAMWRGWAYVSWVHAGIAGTMVLYGFHGMFGSILWQRMSETGYEDTGLMLAWTLCDMFAATGLFIGLTLTARGVGMTRRTLAPSELRVCIATAVLYLTILISLWLSSYSSYIVLLLIVVVFVLVARSLFVAVSASMRYVLVQTRLLASSLISGRDIGDIANAAEVTHGGLAALSFIRPSDLPSVLSAENEAWGGSEEGEGSSESSSAREGGMVGRGVGRARSGRTMNWPQVEGAPWAHAWWTGVQTLPPSSSSSTIPSFPVSSSSFCMSSSNGRYNRVDDSMDDDVEGGGVGELGDEVEDAMLEREWEERQEEVMAADEAETARELEIERSVDGTWRRHNGADAFAEYATRIALAGTGYEYEDRVHLPRTPLRQLTVFFKLRTILIVWVTTDCIVHVFGAMDFDTMPWLRTCSEDLVALLIFWFICSVYFPFRSAPLISVFDAPFARPHPAIARLHRQRLEASQSSHCEDDDIIFAVKLPGSDEVSAVASIPPPFHAGVSKEWGPARSGSLEGGAYPFPM